MFHRAARWFPNNEAAVDETTRYTYRELLDNVQRCAALYHDLGVRKGDRVALMLYPSTVHCIALFAAFELGALPAALHVRETAKALSPMVDRLSPRVLVYDASTEEKAKELLDSCPTVTGSIRARSSVDANLDPGAKPIAEIPGDLKNCSMDFEPMPVYESDPAAIVLSSGTTGIPKGIVHTNGTLTNGARGGVYNYNGLKPSDALLNIFTTSFVAWYNASLPFFNVGAKIVFRCKWDPKAYLEAVQEEKATVAFLVPTMWRMLFAQGADSGEYDLSSIKLAAFAGEVMDPTTLQRIQKSISPHLMQIYGTTELGASAGAVAFEEDMIGEKLASVGKPMLNADIRIIEPGGTRHDECPVGESGEVIIRGPSVASLVWNDPARARKIFEPDGADTWWHSGDMGHLDEDGYLYLEGRVDDMIISGGINIMPARVEEVLLAHPDVTEVAVVGVPDPEWGQRVKAFVVAKGPELSSQDLDGFMKESELADYQRPRLYDFVEGLPRTATGKIDRKALRERNES
jgi:fatty-acyl-CoA synthase